MRERWFWKYRKTVSSTWFRVHRQAYTVKEGVRGIRRKGAIFQEIFLNVVLKLAVSVAVVAVLILVERQLGRFTDKLSWNLDLNAAFTFLGTMAQVSATMLGLYFAAVSLVASTAYARVSGEVRSMIVEEQVGSFYFSFLAQFAATAVVMMTAAALGIKLGVLNIAWLSFVSLFGMFSFVILGLRTFSFFDPAALVEHLNFRLAREIRESTPAGYNWLDASFQNHHQVQAAKALEAYGNLVSIAEQSENLNTKALVELAEGLFSTLSHYAWIKGRIPTDSHWFRRRHQHKQWLLASYTEVEMARATDTALQPELVPDLHWFEGDAIKALARITASLASRADLTGLVDVLNKEQRYTRIAARYGAADEAFKLYHALGREIDKAFATAKFDITSEQRETESLNRVAAVDLHALALLNILLGASHAISETSKEEFEKRFSGIDWSRPESLYTGEVPREILKQCEDIQGRIDFEQRVEGAVLSPPWLSQEVAALGYAQFLSALVPNVLTEFEARFADYMEQRQKLKDEVGAASIATRGLEATNKLDAHLDRMQTWWETLTAMNRSKDWEWPSIDWPAANARSRALRDRLVTQLSACVGALWDLPEGKKYPDLFGHAYSVLADSCFDAMLRGDEKLFHTIFPRYFGTAFVAFDRVRATLGKITNRNMGAALGPITDVLALSGLAELYSPLWKKDFKSVCRKCWDRYFDQLKDAEARKGLIGMLGISKDPAAGMSSRDVLRFRWERATKDFLRGQNIEIEDMFDGGGNERAQSHSDPLVRAFAARGDFGNDAEDIFLSVYVFRRAEAREIEVPHQVESFNRHLEHEEGKKEEDETEE